MESGERFPKNLPLKVYLVIGCSCSHFILLKGGWEKERREGRNSASLLLSPLAPALPRAMSAPKMKGIHHKTRISISTLRLILATGIGLFLGIQFRLLAHTLSSPTQQTEEPLIQPLNATGLRQAIRKLQQQSPLFLFGHTTGHSGSGTFQESLAQPGCFWDITVDKFEYVTEDEKTWANDVKGYDDNCDLTKSKLMPHLTGAIKRKARKLRLVDVQDEDDDDEVEGTVFSNATIAEQLEVLKKELGQQSAAFIDLGKHVL